MNCMSSDDSARIEGDAGRGRRAEAKSPETSDRPAWRPAGESGEVGPGVPEALPRTLRAVGDRLGASAIDQLWIFPPLVRGRREWGLVAAGCFDGDGGRRVVTARYAAERTGKGLYLDSRMLDEGVVPAGRLSRVMSGVAKRGPAPLGGPRLVEIGGGAVQFDSLMSDFADDLFDEAVAGERAA